MKPGKAIVIGASSGIGLEISRQLLAAGWHVAGVARRTESILALGQNAYAYAHDVCNRAEVPELFLRITGDLGGLDLVVYAAGVMPEVGFTEFNTVKDTAMIEVNLLGAIAWLNEAATRMQGTKHGCILAIGSVAGERGRPKQPVYNTSKAALATYMEALRNRLARHGVHVVTVKPGPTQTPMTQGLAIKKAPVDITAAKIIKMINKNGEYFLSPVHRAIFAVIRAMPSPIFRRLKL